MTQAELGTILGLSRATINRWEKIGAGTATLDQVESIAGEIKATMSELLGLPRRPDQSDIPQEILLQLADASPAAINAVQSVLMGFALQRESQASKSVQRRNQSSERNKKRGT